ncbi:MAG: thiamine-phosphate kinase [Limisphaerales bacterium]
MNEFELINQLTQGLSSDESVIVGPGDDCAVLEVGMDNDWLLLKTDAVVEGVHFEQGTEPRRIGHKALARGLSDIAAMGGLAKHALVTVGLPDGFDPGFIKGIYEGLNSLADRFDVKIVGGETTANGDRLMLNISLTGTVPKEKAILRSGAKDGDAIFASGELGGSLEGHHLDFEPRLLEASWLASEFDVHAMIDLSDGLAGDLRHLTTASKVGAELHENAVPVSRAAKLRAQSGDSAKPALLAALTDGEDFELLFTVASKDAVGVLDGWKKEFPDTPIACVGKITSQPGVRIRDARGVREMNLRGFTHFEKN